MKYLILLLAVNCCFAVFSQQQSAVNRSEWNKLTQLSSEYLRHGKCDMNSLERFPVYRLNGGLYVSVFGRVNTQPDWDYTADKGVLKGSVTGSVATCKVPLGQFAQLDFSRIYSYVELPAKAFPHLEKAVKDTRADSVQRGIGLPEAFTGKNVFIGVTDWGFDYTHPTFYDTLLNTSRVYAAWDQYRSAGQAPQNYPYGVEFDTPEELAAAGSDTANIYSYHYHGTHVAGIAGGSGAGKPYRGFGFESQFLFATFLIDAASVLDAFNWMKEKAQLEDKRLVINMSWGLTYMGTLDGNSLLSEAIAQLSAEGVVFVGSAGNNGDVSYHIKKDFNNDELLSRIGFYSYSGANNNWGQSITMWGEENKPFSAGLRVYNGPSIAAETPLYSTATQEAYLDSILVIGNDTIFFNLASENVNPLNQRPNMRLRVKNRFSGYSVVLHSAADEGTVHYWNVTELTTGVGNWGVSFTNLGAGGPTPDAKYSIGEPACSPDVITVAAYQSSYQTAQGNPAGGAIASFTSWGPLYNGAIKPDIAAPGVSVISSISSYTDQGPSTISSANVTFNGRTYKFGSLSGTSMSSPCVTGIVSLMLDANPTLTPAEVKEIIKTTARTDNFTGTISAPGHERWGMGKINAYAAVLTAVEPLLSQGELMSRPGDMIVYPNPASDKLYVLLPDDLQPEETRLITMTGSVVLRSMNENIANLGDLPDGYYIMEVISGERTFRKPLVID